MPSLHIKIEICEVYGCKYLFIYVDEGHLHARFLHMTITLDDQTQVDSKPAGQHEHASLN